MEHVLNPEKLPAALMSREGWSDYLESLRTGEPHLHQIEPTNHCPYTCIMCPRTKLMTRSLGFMDFDLYRKVMEEVAGYSEPVRSKEIELFHFGESLLHPRIHDMVALAAALDLRVTLSVNAPHLTPERADRILEHHPFRLIISFDGYDRESYMRLRGKAADYDKAVRHIEYLAGLLGTRSLSTRITIRMIRLHANESHLDLFRRQWEDRGFHVEIRPFFPWSEKEMVALGEVEKYPAGMPCPFPWQYVVVQWNGDVVPCCRDYNGVNAMGNVRDAPLREIWNGKRYADFRETHRRGEYGSNTFCRECMDIYYTPADGEATAAFRSCPDCSHLPPQQRMRPMLAPGLTADPERGVVESPRGRLALTKPQRILLFLLDRCCCSGALQRKARLSSREFRSAWEELVDKGIVMEVPGAEPMAAGGDELPATLPALWNRALGANPESPMLLCDGDGTVFSRAETRRIVEILAARLVKAGVNANDRVVALGLQSAEVFLVFWASVRLGAVFVPIDPRASEVELQSVLRRVSPRVVFADYAHCRVAGSGEEPEWVALDDPPELDPGSPVRLANWMEAGMDGPAPLADVDAQSPAVILFTSGTTGESKGVRISHGALIRSAARLVRSYGWKAEDVLLSLGDFHTMSGLRNPCVAAVLAGSNVVIASREGRSNARVIAETMSRHGVTVLTTVPAVLKQFADAAGRLPQEVVAHLRQVLCTASHLNPQDADLLRRRFGVPVYNYYGLTETAGICAGIVPGQDDAPAGSIGHPLDSLMILDAPPRQRPNRGTPGELLVFSENLMLDYLDDPTRTAHAFDSGFYRTGDLAYRDSAGWIFLVGRKGDAIKNHQGEFVHPRTLEDALEAEGSVREAGVCGLNVGTEREELVAAIVPAEPVTDVEGFLFALKRVLLGKLGQHRLPARIILTDALPRGTNGKLLRNELKKRLEQGHE